MRDNKHFYVITDILTCQTKEEKLGKIFPLKKVRSKWIPHAPEHK